MKWYDIFYPAFRVKRINELGNKAKSTGPSLSKDEKFLRLLTLADNSKPKTKKSEQ
jgi:hypothetical protein